MTVQVFVNLPTPLSPLSLHLSPSTPLSDLPLPSALSTSQTYLHTRSSAPLDPLSHLSSLQHASPTHPIELFVSARLLGGKGGFGSQLRAAGGRMSSGKNTNTDSCRDLSGRRLSTIKEAQRQAELLETTPGLRASLVAAEKAKLEALERSLGLTTPDDSGPSTSTSAEASGSGSASGSSSVAVANKRLAEVDIEEIARKKHRFDDNKFFEESREIKDNVRSAVAAGLLKKKKKAKVEVGEDTKGKGKAVAKDVKANAAESDKVAMPPPAVAKTAAVA